jgi:hypothetical protein
MVQNVERAANAHGSAILVPIGASLALRDWRISGTVAKRTIFATRRSATAARVCRIPGVTGAEQQA